MVGRRQKEELTFLWPYFFGRFCSCIIIHIRAGMVGRGKAKGMQSTPGYITWPLVVFWLSLDRACLVCIARLRTAFCACMVGGGLYGATRF
jgi:hypothetical protein